MPDWGYLLIIAAAVVAGRNLVGRDPSRRADLASLPTGVADLPTHGPRFEAIKLVREITGMHLRSAREFAEDQARVLDRSGQG